MKILTVSLILVTIFLSRSVESGEIHDAAAAGKLEKVQALLAAKPDLVNAKGTDDGTPLFWATVGGHKAVAEFLLAHQADVNARDYKGGTPLHLARDKALAELLLAHGADVNAKDVGGSTPLHRAVCQGLTAVIETLLAHGADVNAKDKSGQTPLHWAAHVLLHCQVASPDRLGVSALLLAHKANVNALDHNGKSPLDLAVEGNHREMVELLRQHGGK